MRSWQVFVLAAAASGGSAFALVVYPDTADASIRQRSLVPSDIVVEPVASQHTLGNNGGYIYCFVLPFQLPAIPAGHEVASATLRMGLLRNAQAPGFNGDVYGLPARAAPTVLVSDYFLGAVDPSAALLADDAIRVDNTDINAYVDITVSGQAIVDYLNEAYGAEGAGSFALFRVNADATPASSLSSYFAYGAEFNFPGPGNDRRPTLEVTFAPIPTPGAGMVGAAGVGMLAMRRRRR